MDKLQARYRKGALVHAKPLRRTRFFGRAHFALLKKQLDLQVFSRIGTMKKLQ